MPSRSTKPQSKESIAITLKTTGSSWPRPSKALEAAVTVHSPVLDGIQKKQSTTEQEPQKRHLLPLFPLASLSTISELPKVELLEEIPTPTPSAPNPPSPKQRENSQEKDAVAAELADAAAMDEENAQGQDSQGTPGPFSRLPLAHPVSPANVPLLRSPLSDEEIDPAERRSIPTSKNDVGSIQQLDSQMNEPESEAIGERNDRNDEGKEIESLGIASILPQWMADQLPRQDSAMADSRSCRTPSVFPGAYPESDSMDDTPIPSPGSNTEAARTEDRRIEPSVQKSSQASVRPRKSVSIALPNTNDDPGEAEQARQGSTQYQEVEETRLATPSPKEDTDHKINREISEEVQTATQDKQPQESDLNSEKGLGAVAEDEQSQKTYRDRIESAPQAEKGPLLKPSQTSIYRGSSPASRTSSIAASQQDTERLDASTLNERESLAPSDADNYSLLPLLSSSPRDAHSSRFSESLDDQDRASTGTRPGKQPEAYRMAETDSPPIADELSSLSTISSSNASGIEMAAIKKSHEYPFPAIDRGEGPSHAASSLPTPRIVVKDASDAEESLQSPLRAPTTTPEQHSPSPRRQATFAALGELSEHQGPAKLPMQRRKLYIRKVRYAMLRRPILNAALGRQVGAQAKLALKKLANGELIVVEPPTTL